MMLNLHLSSCVGVWDTVGSVSGALDVLAIKDDFLPASIDVALHAVSMQDNRNKFQPTLWAKPSTGLRAGQMFNEVRFLLIMKLARSLLMTAVGSSGSLELMLTSEGVTNAMSWLTSRCSGWR